ncbi:hypothetical protein KF146HA_00001 [Lactococcus lactis]|nr:hypothetical protein [Lactococcus lactis]
MKKEFKILFLKQDNLDLNFYTLFYSFVTNSQEVALSIRKNIWAGSFRVDNIQCNVATIFNFLLIFMARKSF